jgi:hypothetical protein
MPRSPMGYARRLTPRFAALAGTTLALAGFVRAGAEQLDPAAVEFFESRIRPVLVEHCYECHSAADDSPQGDLRLDTAAALRQGGASGAAVAPGQPAESLLLSALRYETFEMPPTGKLPDDVIVDFETWISMGAPDPRVDTESADGNHEEAPASDPRDHWSLKAPIKPTPPAAAELPNGDWARSEVDAFILARLASAGLEPSTDAEPRTLLRRLSIDLTGLPPTAEELDAFAAAASDADYERAVDRLLASPRFGERWGRHWLDVARYADTKGYVFQEDRNYAGAYKYRDWVIGAFNADLPFDQFVVAQIAADQTEDQSDASAQGFLTLGRRFLNNAADINDDRIDLMTRGLMGLTVACARCHDHKYDAIPTADYYSLYGVLASSTETKPEGEAPTLADAPQPVEQVVFVRGNPGIRGEPVTRHFLSCLTGGEPKDFANGSGRLELAQAIASRDNPLTARVWANRVWARLFGQGLVTTPSDFGIRGEPPTHPELLDWLATTLMDDGWSTKRLIRRIVVSSVYRQSSAPRVDVAEVDGANALLARMNRRRLDLEAMRDGLLLAAGRLDETMGGPSVQLTEQPFPTRRAVYGFVERQNLPAFFRTFDFANPNTPAASRPQTASPQQALYFLNSPFAIEQARELANRSAAVGGGDAPARVAQLYEFALRRSPTEQEIAGAVSFVAAGESFDAAATIAAAPRWQYGWGVHDRLSDRVDFHPFPHFAAGTWQGGEALPDANLRWALLNVDGGHPGVPGKEVIRRWTAPATGQLRIDGQLGHGNAEGDGVAARIVSSSRGKLGEWTAINSSSATAIEATPVAAGDVIDFVVDCRANDGYDAFTWRTTLRLEREDGQVESWNSHDGIDGPKPPAPPPLDRWGQLAQVLLMCNEFMFVD